MSVLGKRKVTAMNCNAEESNSMNQPKRQKLDLEEHHDDAKKKIKKRKSKQGQPPSKGHRIEKIPSYYFFLNGYRYIAPYDYEYRCFAKGRWFKREIYEVMTTEFVAYDAMYYKNAILSGKILVCNQKVGLKYVIKNGDWITHSIHRHEPPVVHKNIDIVHETDDIMVINKPSGIAIHPSGKYRYNTLIYILYNELGRELYSAHRLDRVTSGLMLLCKTKQVAKRLGETIRNRNLRKTYLARVKGAFPSNDDKKETGENKSDDVDGEHPIITVNQAIRCKDHQRGVHEIHDEGKEALTEFKFVSYNGTSSLVECYPKTGRTHQIRLHLQYLGHPIVNDFAYGGEELNTTHWIPSNEEERSKLRENVKRHWNDNCDECRTILKEIDGEKQDIRNSAPEIFLHALKYECDEFSYSVPKPYWAQP